MPCNRKTLLLHICCGPCATQVVRQLKEEFDVTGFFYNPNIEPREEYELRLRDARHVANRLSIPLLIDPWYNHAWRAAARGMEQEPEGGLRCAMCFRFRMKRTAELCAEKGFEMFATTLTISPHKNARLINEIGASLQNEQGVEFLARDFKKNDGFKHSVELSRAWGLRRQTYCGCLFSQRERAEKKARRQEKNLFIERGKDAKRQEKKGDES